MFTALSIAGSDPSGGAGLQADLKVFHQFGVYGMAVVSLLTVQNTTGVTAVECLKTELVIQQLRAVLTDIPPRAAKTGALGNRELIEAIAREAASFDFPLVVDPVMMSKHGAHLLTADGQHALRSSLLPQTFLVTPNIPEAEALCGFPIRSISDMEHAGREISRLGAKNVLVKGGHLETAPIDVLWTDDGAQHFHAIRVSTSNTHGTGCTLSSAITALLARGVLLVEAVKIAKAYISNAIATNPGLGHGCGPVNTFAEC